jgi:hypothetical protein
MMKMSDDIERQAIRDLMARLGVDMSKQAELEANLSPAAREQMWEMRIRAFRARDPKVGMVIILEDTAEVDGPVPPLVH